MRKNDEKMRKNDEKLEKSFKKSYLSEKCRKYLRF